MPKFLKSAYRKEPISAFILLFGSVNAVIGGFEERWTLLSFGVTLSLLAFVLRWWQIQKARSQQASSTARYFLPASSSRTPLPMLQSDKQHR